MYNLHLPHMFSNKEVFFFSTAQKKINRFIDRIFPKKNFFTANFLYVISSNKIETRRRDERKKILLRFCSMNTHDQKNKEKL